MGVVDNNHLVFLNYVVTDGCSGEILDSNKDKPFKFILGQNQIIPGLEKALYGKAVGSSFRVEIPSKDAYGERNNSLLQEVSKSQFSGIELTKGMTLFGQSDNGQTVQVVVSEIGEESVIIDYNHPLAGKNLIFDVDILDSREPTDDEILEVSNISNNSGGCCGGSGGCGCKH